MPHDPWAQRTPRASLPPDVQKIVDDFLSHPDRKKDIQVATAVIVQFVKRAQEVGPFLALAEMDNREARIAVANTLREIKQAVGRPAIPG